MGRYTQKLIENLEKLDHKNQYFVFLNGENFNEYKPKNLNFKKILANCPWYTIREQIKMPWLLNRYNLDLVHFPHFNVPFFYWKKFIVTIHDLILIHYPTIRGTTLNPLLYWLKFMVYKIVIATAIHRSQKIIAVSKFTKNDILKHYRVPHEKIIVTYEACENYCHISREKSDTILKKHGIIKPYLLYVGNAYPHKNLDKLIEEFLSSAVKDKYYLVLIGKEDYFYNSLKNSIASENAKKIIFPGYISDRDLDIVYRGACLYVFPSLYEGFGLPPLEAMAKGVPVLASDHPCLKEILEDSAYFIDVKQKGNIADGIKKIIFNNNLKHNLIKKGYRQCEKYRWSEMASKTLDSYIKYES